MNPHKSGFFLHAQLHFQNGFTQHPYAQFWQLVCQSPQIKKHFEFFSRGLSRIGSSDERNGINHFIHLETSYSSITGVSCAKNLWHYIPLTHPLPDRPEPNFVSHRKNEGCRHRYRTKKIERARQVFLSFLLRP